MKLQTAATRVAERTAHLINAKAITQFGSGRAGPIAEPAWYRVLLSNPPTQQLLPKAVRLEEYAKRTDEKVKLGEFNEKTGTWVTKTKARHNSNSKHLYKIRKLEFFEDRIRQLFFKQHPWELARPKMVLEKDGREAIKYNWSTMNQRLKALDVESVVQRTLWLMQNDPKCKDEHWMVAYDLARLEFYRLRLREEANVAVAAEEAIMLGSVFGKSALEHGLEQEQAAIDKWVDEATIATRERRARRAGPVSYEEPLQQEETDDANTTQPATA
jgi:small subunit ribosomal protein S23